MPLIKPFRALRPKPGLAAQVVAPPYDVVSFAEARALAQGKPYSFLHVSRPEIDLDPSLDPYAAAVYKQGNQTLQAWVAKGLLLQDSEAGYYLYQMQEGDHRQTGVVAAASVAAYDANNIVKHELTRNDKEQDRVRMIDGMNAQASPVLLACPPHAPLAALMAQETSRQPDEEVVGERGVIHRLWKLNAASTQTMDALFNGPQAFTQKLYIADGHHRSAAASRVCAQRLQTQPQAPQDAAFRYFLSVIYLADEMKILDYNRVVADLHGLSKEDLLKALNKDFLVRATSVPHRPTQAGEMGMFLGGTWYALTIKPDRVPQDPTESLDVSLLMSFVLRPWLGIENPRTDKRIDFVGGIRGLKELEAKVKSGDWAVAFALYPTSMSQIMQVADAGQIMPPKSTWFEPKLVDGLVTHLL